MLTSEDVFENLRSVMDPELNVNIVDLGLIYHVEVKAQGDQTKIKITMTLTTPGCPLGTTIVRMMRDSLAAYPFLNPERDVTVDIVFDPPWVSDMMSEAAKAELGF